MMKHNRMVQNKKGVSLLEMLLTIMVVSGLLVAIFQLLEDYAEKELAVATSKYMENIALAVQDVINDPVYFQEVYTMADARPSDVLELSLDDLVNGFGVIPASTRLNANIRNGTPIGSPVTVLLHIADNPADANDTQAMEIIVATTERLLDERIRRVAVEAGPYGGLMREAGQPIRSAYATWNINPTDLAGTTFADTVAANPPSIDDGGYLVHYRYANFEDAAGDYMFRVSIPGRPELNRMFTTLNMGGHNIMGTDNFDVSGSLTLEGRALISGQMNVGGNTTVQKGDVIAGQRYTTTNTTVRGTGGGVTGALNVDDSINIRNVNLTGELNADTANLRSGLVSTNQVTSDDIVLNGGIGSANRINATILQGRSAAPDVNVQGQLNAVNYTTQNIAINGGNVGVLDAKTTGNVTVQGQLRADNVGLGNTSVNVFGTCDKGC